MWDNSVICIKCSVLLSREVIYVLLSSPRTKSCFQVHLSIEMNKAALVWYSGNLVQRVHLQEGRLQRKGTLLCMKGSWKKCCLIILEMLNQKGRKSPKDTSSENTWLEFSEEKDLLEWERFQHIKPPVVGCIQILPHWQECFSVLNYRCHCVSRFPSRFPCKSEAWLNFLMRRLEQCPTNSFCSRLQCGVMCPSWGCL